MDPLLLLLLQPSCYSGTCSSFALGSLFRGLTQSWLRFDCLPSPFAHWLSLLNVATSLQHCFLQYLENLDTCPSYPPVHRCYCSSKSPVGQVLPEPHMHPSSAPATRGTGRAWQGVTSPSPCIPPFMLKGPQERKLTQDLGLCL